MEPAATYKYLGLPPESYRALKWVFPTWARAHALYTGEVVNVLKVAIVTADRIMTDSQVPHDKVCARQICLIVW